MSSIKNKIARAKETRERVKAMQQSLRPTELDKKAQRGYAYWLYLRKNATKSK